MKKHLLLSAVITAGVGANVSASENIIPYLPTKVILETEVPQNNYKSLDFDSPFSLEVIAENNSVITICNTLIKGIDYKVTEGGKYRFSFDGTEIYVYKDSRFLESLKPAVLNYHDVFADTDDSILKTGIYSEKNHFLNPGFEDMDEGETETNNQYIPAVWRSTNFYEGSRSRVNTNYGNNLNGIEGRGALMHHGYTPGTGMYFYQELSTLKPESEYMVTFRTWSHSNAFGGYTAKMGTSENGTEITSYSWTQAETAYDKKDISFTFKTPAFEENTSVFFTVCRVEGSATIGHFDRMTLVEKNNAAPEESGLYGEGFSNVTFETGTAFAPVVNLEEGQYFDLSSMIKDAAVTSASNWSGTALDIKSSESYTSAPDIYYLDKWEQGILTVDIYQEIKELPTGKYKLVAAGRSNDDAYSFYANNSSETKYVSIINNSNTGGDLGNGWNDVEIDNIIVKTGYLKIGASGTATKNGAWISIDNFRLYYYGADLSLIHDELNDLIAKANNFDFESVPAGVAENLKETILKAQSVEEKEESIRAMIDELTLVLSEANSYIEYFTSLKTSIEEIESLQNSWFNDLIEDAKAVAESESPTLDELISAKDDLFDGIIKMMDKYSGISFTQSISNPSINNGTNGWTINNKNGNHTYTKGEHYTYDNMNTYLDSWNGTKGALDYEAKQTVSALPNGLYVVSAAARASGTGSFIFANNMKKEIPNNGSSDGELGEGWNFVRVPVIVKDGTVVLGCHTTPGLWTGTWFSADDFGLTQYPYSDEYLAIEDVEADNIKVFIVNGYIYVEGVENYEIYDMTGRIMNKKQEFTKGVYFINSNGKTKSVMVK